MVGAQGYTVIADWPAGELYQGEIMIHQGTVNLTVTVIQSGPAQGTPQLAVIYQVCTDRVCLRPTTQVLPLTITAP